jgi:hypothetical protein
VNKLQRLLVARLQIVDQLAPAVAAVVAGG